MAWLYCPDESIDTTTGQCSDPHWVQQFPGGFPPLSGAEGAQIAGAILSAWALGYVARLINRSLRNRS